MDPVRVYTIRGAGLGFLASAIVFVLTWNFLAFVLVPVGAAAGYLLGRAGGVKAGALDRLGGSPPARAGGRLLDLITSPNLAARTLNLWMFGFALFLAAWIVGYYLLPEGFFRSGVATQLEGRGLGGPSESVAAEWWGLIRNNLIPFVLIVLANLTVRFNRIPLGYMPPLYNLLFYGLVLGTNSFAIPYPERLAPTLAVFQRAGPYEMTAFILAAAATATWSRYEVRQLFRTNPERVPGAPNIRWRQAALLALAAALLAGAAYIEARMIVAAMQAR